MKQLFKDAAQKALPGFLAISMAIVVFFCISRYDGLGDAWNKLVKIMTPFIYGGVLSYLLKRPFNFFQAKLEQILPEKRKQNAKGLALLIILVFFFAAIALLIILIVPALAKSIIGLVSQIPPFLEKINQLISNLNIDDEVINNYVKQATDWVNNNGLSWVQSHILPRLQELMGQMTVTLKSVGGLMYNLLLALIIMIYVLLSKDTFARQGTMIVRSVFKEKAANAVLDEFRFIDDVFSGFFVGKIIDSAIVGLICYAFCLILQFTMGMNNAVLIAVIVGVTNVIPYFGPYIGAIPSALLILIDSPTACVIFVIFIIILQQIDGNVLGPMLLSGSVGLSGFWVLFSITVIGGLMGFVGILIGVPVFAIIYDLIKRAVYAGLRNNNVVEYLPKPQNTSAEEKKGAQKAGAKPKAKKDKKG